MTTDQMPWFLPLDHWPIYWSSWRFAVTLDRGDSFKSHFFDRVQDALAFAARWGSQVVAVQKWEIDKWVDITA